MPAEQLHFFASLDFPGRSTVMIREIAERLGISVRHLLNEVNSGTLIVLDLKAAGSTRRCARVPIEAYRDYVLARLTGPMAVRHDLIRNLPASVRRQLIRELQQSLSLNVET